MSAPPDLGPISDWIARLAAHPRQVTAEVFFPPFKPSARALFRNPAVGVPDAVRRFWLRVDTTGPAHPQLGTPCWLWTGATRGRTGYGAVKLDGRVHDTHRVAYQFAVGEIPAGLLVRHKCDVRLCCNPEHLETGTKLDNHRDMVERGRRAGADAATSRRLRARRDTVGVHSQKLTPDQVEAIRAEWARGGYTHKSLGALFGIGRSQIGRIVRGERWVDGPRPDSATARKPMAQKHEPSRRYACSACGVKGHNRRSCTAKEAA